MLTQDLTILRIVHLAIAHAHIICEHGVTSENGETVCNRFDYNPVIESFATLCSEEKNIWFQLIQVLHPDGTASEARDREVAVAEDVLSFSKVWNVIAFLVEKWKC